jgi:hypothetical protein
VEQCRPRERPVPELGESTFTRVVVGRASQD